MTLDPFANLTAELPGFVTHLECSMTGERYPAGELHGLSRAGRPLLVRYDLAAVRRALTKEVLAARPADMWRWRELLPVARARDIVSLGEPVTPLLPLQRAAARRGVRAPLVKDERRMPTGSFKARGLAMAISMARALGVGTITMPTNGNAGAAAAAYAARAGLQAVILCPAQTPDVNVREIAAAGARVYRVDGQIDDCGRITAEAARVNGWLDLSTLKEPYRVEGKKTIGLELAEQLDWELPDAIFFPTGGGTAVIGMWKAFEELEAIGFIGARRPRMFAVQSTGCAPLVRAFEAGERHAERWQDAETIAAGIRVPGAVGDFLVLDAVRASGGAAIAVDDADILDAVDEAAREGLLICPEGGATLAAYDRALATGQVARDDRVVLFNCATALKYPMPDRARILDRHAPIDYTRL